MTNRLDAARLQPVLLGVALAAALLAALALLLSGRAIQQQLQLREHMAALTSLSQNIPLQAGAAVRGSAPAFDALAESRARLEKVLAAPAVGEAGSEAGWPVFLEQAQAVLDGRKAALDAQAAAAAVRELTPQLVAAAAGVAQAAGAGRTDPLMVHLERF